MTESIERNIAVSVDVRDVYALWEDFENFPQFMKHILSVRRLDGANSHWTMRGPLGKRLHWYAVMTVCEPFSEIAWRSTGGDMRTSGRVTFRPLAAGQTEVSVRIEYDPPLGRIGRWFAHYSGDPEERLEADLQNFKHFAESLGAIAQTHSPAL